MRTIIFWSAIMLTSITMMGQDFHYPQAPKDSTVDDYFGIKVNDPFRPLENDRSAETSDWVEAENAITNSYLAKIPFRKKLLDRLTEVANYEKVGIPFEKHDKWYIFRNNGLQNQSVLYQMDRLNGEQRVFLDPNKLSNDGTVALQSTTFSNNGKYMAYSQRRGKASRWASRM